MMSMFDEYKANHQVKPNFDEERKARDERAAAKEADKRSRRSRRRSSALVSMSSLSSDDSLLLFPVGQSQTQKSMDATNTESRANTTREVAPTPNLYKLVSRWRKEKRMKK